MKKEVRETLAKPFNLKEREGLGDKRFKYVASGDIIERMHTVFEGKWNVELIDSKVVEEQLLVLVRVSVDDEGSLFFQDGYASYPIFRFTSGPNKGKVIDIGNSYRSAMTKAIKTACSRWGVALFLEESTVSADNSDMPASAVMDMPPHTPTESDVPMPAEPMGSPEKVVNAEPTQPASIPPVPDIPIPAEPVNNPEKVERPRPWPDAPVDELVFTNNSVVAPDPGNFPSNVEVPPLTGVEVSESTETAENLTPVQKVAIESLMSVNKIKFKDLFMKAIPGQEAPSSIEVISYLDAVKLIQCGNHLRPTSNL